MKTNISKKTGYTKPSLVTSQTTPGCEKKNPSRSFKPEKFVGNLKQKLIWKGLTGKTVVEVSEVLR